MQVFIVMFDGRELQAKVFSQTKKGSSVTAAKETGPFFESGDDALVKLFGKPEI